MINNKNFIKEENEPGLTGLFQYLGGYFIMISKKVRTAIIRGQEKEPTKRDFPLIKKRLIYNSLAGTYDEAKCEWEFTGIIDEEDIENFSDRCDLCNQSPLAINFEIYNVNTKRKLLVGSSCIRKFLILNGAGNSEESWEIFSAKARQVALFQDLRLITRAILIDIPNAMDVARFRRLAAEALGLGNVSDLNNCIERKNWELFLSNTLGPKKDDITWKKDMERIKLALFSPKDIKVIKTKDFDSGQSIGKWANKGRRKTRIETTLSRSAAYRNPGR